MQRICLHLLFITALVPRVLGGQATKTGPSAPLDLQAYTSELDRWWAAAGRLRANPEQAAELRKRLPEHWSVGVQDQRFEVSTAWLAEALDRLAKNPKSAADISQEITHRLESMRQDSQALAQTSQPDVGRARGKLENILKQREYRSIHAAPPVESLWDQFIDWIWNFVTRILGRASGHPRLNKVLLWGIVVVLGLALLAWLVHLLFNLSLSDFSRPRVRIPGDEPVAAGSWLELAQRSRDAAGRGEFREAIRILYNAAVRRIEEAGTWRADPARTHREYLRLLPADSSDRPRLAAITTCFERVWYGHAPASANDYDAALAQLESMR